MPDGRLLRAVGDAAAPIAELGFAVIDSDDSGRGTHVHLSNGAALMNTDGAPRAVGDVVDLTRVKGLHLRRLGKSVSAEVLASQLRRVFDALAADARDLLTRS